jgi:type I restriction enzyme S subunit
MTSYKRLGDYIQPVDERNRALEDLPLMGLSVTKEFIPSVANIVGTDLSKYKVIKKQQFACSLMQISRDGKIPVAMYESNSAIMSPAYPMFEVKDKDVLMPEYLMMWFSRAEFDRQAAYYAIGGVRGSLDWKDFLNLELPIPPIEKQREIVAEYNAVQKKIDLNNQLIQKLEEVAQDIFNSLLEKGFEKNTCRLGDLIKIKGGFSYNSQGLEMGNSYLLGMGCVSFDNRFVEDGIRLYLDNVPEQHIVKPKDIIIATRQQSENLPILGCPAMIPPYLENRKLVIASNLYRVENKSELSNEIIYQILRSKNYQEHIKFHTKGTTVGMITKDAIEDYTFETPLFSLLYNFQGSLNKIADNIFSKRTENQKLIELKDLLLSKLIRY